MASPPETTEGPIEDRGLTRLRQVIEALVALVLVVIGISELRSVKEPGPWMPFGLIGLALLVYSLRGRGLSEMELTPSGLKVKVERLEQRTKAAEEKAEVAEAAAAEAKQTATTTNEFVTQVAPKPSALQAEVRRSAALIDPWDHPGLERTEVKPWDPQQGQWGGAPDRNGRLLSAKVSQHAAADWFTVVLEVRSTDPQKPLTNNVRFHLHDTYRPSVLMEEPKHGVARLERLAYGAYTVGAEVENEPETYLELNLAQLPDAPRTFKER